MKGPEIDEDEWNAYIWHNTLLRYAKGEESEYSYQQTKSRFFGYHDEFKRDPKRYLRPDDAYEECGGSTCRMSVFDPRWSCHGNHRKHCSRRYNGDLNGRLIKLCSGPNTRKYWGK